MPYRDRLLVRTVRVALKTFPAVLVTGPRQSGKTTLLREEFGSSHRYLSLERPDVRARALADPVAFLDESPPPLILDEIQYAPALLHYVKDRIDGDRRPGQWLLSGSQSFPLMRGVSQTLAGRVAVLTLDPLSCAETLDRRKPPSIDDVLERVFGEGRANVIGRVGLETRIDLGDWLLRGGYPEIRLDPEVDRQIWFSSYVQTYLERDVRDLLKVGDLDSFRRFLALMAARTATELNMSEVGSELGITGPTVKSWLSVLEASQIVYQLRPYFRNFGKRLVKRPKVYFLDPGLASYLVGLHTREAILNGPSAGVLTETAVVGEWVKAFRQRGEQPTLHYWRSTNGAEVDLLIERNGVLHALEVKATATPMPDHAAAVARWMELAGPRVRAALACRVDRPTALRPGIRAVPWHLAW